jgi:hypothetical protein
MRACTVCGGTGKNSWNNKSCFACKGKGYFPEPNYMQILEGICTSRGSKKAFRRSKPPVDESTVHGARIYFVWRLTRFHGGADVTMPMLAELAIEGDPYHDELDAFAGKIAEIVFGTQFAATARWGTLLGLGHVSGELPASAYEGGPVLLDGNKPIQELIELL